MKKLLFAIEFIFVLFFFVLPPIFSTSKSPSQINFTFSIQKLLPFIFSAGLFYWNKEIYSHQKQMRKQNSFITLHGEILTHFGILLLISVIIQSVLFFSKKYSSETFGTNMNFQLNGIYFAEVFITLLTGSLYEEIIYRFYLPEKASILFPQKIKFLQEAVSVIFFALAHLYQGIFGVINAALAGTVLRHLFIKTGSIVIVWGVHFVWNAGIFLLTLLIQ